MTGSRYRKGMIPSKKFFTETGGIGARSAPIRNIILAQATPKRPAPVAPTPATSNTVNLFNIYSFSNRFDGKAYTGFPDKKLESAHWMALIAASLRWKNLISFNSDLLNVIKTMYKAKFDKDWKGYELLGINYSVSGSPIANAAPILFKGTKIPYGFVLGINNAKLIKGSPESDGTFSKFEQKNIEDVLAHELGHVLGLCNVLAPEYIITPESSPNANHTYYLPTLKCILGGQYGQFPATYLENRKLLSSAVEKAISSSPYITLENGEGKGKHWEQYMVSHVMWGYNPPPTYNKITEIFYGNFYNELMTPTYSPLYANKTYNFLISGKSLKYLIEARVDGHRAYNEISPGASEVKSTIKFANAGSTLTKPDYTYILIGTRCVIVAGTKGINGAPPIITIEKALAGEDAADAAVETDTYNVIYPPGYIGERDDDEILRIVASHKGILNDPSFAANTIECCSGHTIEGA